MFEMVCAFVIGQFLTQRSQCFLPFSHIVKTTRNSALPLSIRA